MTDPSTLTLPTELVAIRCLSCRKVLANVWLRYRLLRKTLNEIVSKIMDEVPENQLDEVGTRPLQVAYDAVRDNQLRIVEIERLRALSGVGITSQKLSELWPSIERLSGMHDTARKRNTTRLEYQREAAAFFKEEELKRRQQNVSAAQAELINIDDTALFDALLQLYAQPAQLQNPDFEVLSLHDKLETIHYPFEDRDPQWYTAAVQQLGQYSQEVIGEALANINNIPKYEVLPVKVFTDEEWYQLRGFGTAGINFKDETFEQYRDKLKRIDYPAYGRVAMDILNIRRQCCRMYLGQPVILPEEARLTLQETRDLEQRNPNVLVLTSRYTSLEQPTTQAVSDFMSGRINAKAVYSKENTRGALAPNTTTIAAPLLSTIEGGGITTTSPTAPIMNAPVMLPTVIPPIFTQTQPLPQFTPTESTSIAPGVKPLDVDDKPLPPLTFGGKLLPSSRAVTTRTRQIRRRDIHITPFTSDEERTEPSREGRIQPGGLEIPRERRPRGTRVYTAR